ncbi:MAG: hypothetical protein KBC26_00520 [Candidatus Pacebacteria bacterium]|nr:hypothetical protein [Candidatus Paceibacterota bacterium]
MVDFEQIRRDRERSKKGRRVFLVFVLAILLCVLVAVLAIFRGPWLHVQMVFVDGVHSVSEAEVIQAIQAYITPQSWGERLILPHGTIVGAFFKRKTIEDNLLRAYPSFFRGDLSIDLFSRSVRFSVAEREQYGLWCSKNEGCSWFDVHGIVFAPGPVTEGQLIKKVIDTTDRVMRPGDCVLDQETTTSLLSIFSFLETVGVSGRTLVLESYDAQEVRTIGNKKPVLYFSTRFDPFSSLKTVERLLASKTSLEYIDLRVKNRVYYK